MIQSTTNYEIFKKMSCNRQVLEQAVRHLMASIQMKDMLKLRPIIVNKDMEVLDGQHRLEAAKRLHKTIYYTIDDKSETEDVILLNANQKNWAMEDYLNFHYNQGIPAYVGMRRFLEENNMSYRMFKMLHGEDNTAEGKNFKNGTMKQITKQEFDKVLSLNSECHEIIEFLKMRRSDLWKVFKSSLFIRAMARFLTRKDIDYEDLKKNLEVKIDAVGPRSGVGGYYLMFVQIYNFRKRDAIPVEEDEDRNDFFDRIPKARKSI